MEVMGNGGPLRNRPFLSTREMFLLKDAATKKERIARYTSLDKKGRRLFLDELNKQPRAGSLELGSTPAAIDKIEWFASAADLCRAIGLAATATAKRGRPHSLGE